MGLSVAEMNRLRRFNTPAVYNGWEQITRHDRRSAENREATTDFMPEMGPMVGRAVTVVCEPGNAEHQRAQPDAPAQYRRYIASIEGPKIVVVQDLDKPQVIGAFWGEVMANTHRRLGCVGTITDGAVRDLDEMKTAGFKALARRLCVGHAYSWPVRWGCDVEVFGRKVSPGDLIHADKHGFLVVPAEDEDRLLDATSFMDGNECDTVIAAATAWPADSLERRLAMMDEAGAAFGVAAKGRYGKAGEW